jgi:hypothetical protein
MLCQKCGLACESGCGGRNAQPINLTGVKGLPPLACVVCNDHLTSLERPKWGGLPTALVPYLIPVITHCVTNGASEKMIDWDCAGLYRIP